MLKLKYHIEICFQSDEVIFIYGLEGEYEKGKALF